MYQRIKALFSRSHQPDLEVEKPEYISRPPINATTVDSGFIPPQPDAVWVSDGEIKEFMRNGYSFCPHPDGGDVCVRFHNKPPKRLLMDWLLIPPKGRGDV
ncbi:hypothetical protein QRD43_21890 [Pelomonas sp. APW6]|uniref:Uncharacterized protein n=1 Tax=Roseateles subflavus TaxID=3053353 RepID=A0ABT7LQS7_9BURK|nr:hypothetical protein [Pelomonas sp. APW6]MDL5034572.1 hypothetical protein [Pelomonas sp. APW6]